MATIPADWTQVQNIIRSAVEASSGLEAIWRDQNSPGLRLDPGFASLKLISPPKIIGRPEVTRLEISPTEAGRRTEADAEFTVSVQFHARGDNPPSVAQVVTVQVVGHANGLYRVTVDGHNADFTATGSTVTQIRDALITALAGYSDTVTAAAVSTDSLTITAVVPGVPFDYAVTAPSSGLTATLATPNHLRVDTNMLAARLKADFADPDFRQPLTEAGIAWTTRATVADLSVISGADWEARTSIDLGFRVRYRHDRTPVDWFDSTVAAPITISPAGEISGPVDLP